MLECFVYVNTIINSTILSYNNQTLKKFFTDSFFDPISMNKLITILGFNFL